MLQSSSADGMHAVLAVCSMHAIPPKNLHL